MMIILMEQKVNDAERGTEPCSVVLRDAGVGSNQRYVVHLRNDRDGSHFWGNYFSDRGKAEEDFYARVRKWAHGKYREQANG